MEHLAAQGQHAATRSDLDRVVVLREYEAAEVTLDEVTAVALSAAGGQALTISTGSAVGRHVLRASSQIGTIRAGALQVQIQPKVPISNVLHLLIGGGPAGWLRTHAADYAAAADTTAAVAQLYAHLLTDTLARGPVHEYREHRDELVAIRGRIDIGRQLRHPERRSPIHCTYGDRTADNDLNRYVRAATQALRRAPGVPDDARRLLRHGVVLLDGVDGPAPAVEWADHVRLTRLTTHYRPLLALARVVRAGTGLGHAPGAMSASAFLLDMNTVFERFVTESIRRSLRGRYEATGQERTHLDVEGRVQMRPDLVIRRRDGSITGVGDIKYKLTDDGRGRPDDYYQLLAYCSRYGLRDGMLIYATADGETPPMTILTHGDSARLHTRSLDLTSPPAAIDDALQLLADRIAAASV